MGIFQKKQENIRTITFRNGSTLRVWQSDVNLMSKTMSQPEYLQTTGIYIQQIRNPNTKDIYLMLDLKEILFIN